MTAIRAKFVFPKYFASRPVVQLIFEIDVSEAENAMKVLGHPIPGEDSWCGIARICDADARDGNVRKDDIVERLEKFGRRIG